MKNLVKRGNVYYVSAVVNGRRISQSLQTRCKQEAITRARGLLAAARREKWDVLDSMKSRAVHRFATVNELIDTYREVSKKRALRDGSPQPQTVQANINQLFNILGKALEG